MNLPGQRQHLVDEESNLYPDITLLTYGSIHKVPSSDGNMSSRGNSDGDERSTYSSIVRRKKHRLQQRQRTSRIVSLLPNRLLEEDSRRPDLVLPSLDPNAQEVIASIPTHNSIDQLLMRQSHVNLSTVREKYRFEKQRARYHNEEKSYYEHIKTFLTYLSKYINIKNILHAKKTIITFVYLDLLVDLIFCLAYVVEMREETYIDLDPFWMYKNRSYNLWLLCVALTYWDMCSFAIRFLIATHPISVLFSPRAILELITTVPFFVSTYVPNGQYIYVPYFLRSWVLLLRIKSAMKIKINLQITDKSIDPLRTKLIHLIGTIVTLLYNGTCAFQYCETTFGGTTYTTLESLYVVMVTLSTVGYGDITPNTQGSRIVMMLLIVIALSVLPGIIADVCEIIQKRKDGEGHVSKGSDPFVLIVGTFTPEQVVEILDGFLNSENAQLHLNVVFLDINRPTEQLKLLERNSIWGHRVQYLYGSVLDEKTLMRVEARHAQAIFTISDQNAPIPSKEDERNTVRLWSLYCHTVSHEVPIYTYNLSPSTAIYQKVAKEIICVREFKQFILSMNCRCRGASTLITNLLHQRQPINKYDEGWQAQYDDGSCNEIYTKLSPNCIQGMTFEQAVLFIYEETQVLLFAIKTFTNTQGEYQILLNPGDSYKIKQTDECVYIAESPREIRFITKLKKPVFYNSLSLRREFSSISQDSFFQFPEEKKTAKDNFNHNRPDYPRKSLKRSTSTYSNILHSSLLHNSSGSVVSQKFGISELPSKRHALLTGSRAFIKRIGQSSMSGANETENMLPSCFLLNEPVSLEDITIDSTEGISDHIVVCLHREVINMFKFIYNMRSPCINIEDLQDIVLLCSKKPSKKIFDSINTFPRVYYMEGNCRHPDDLLRAGVKRAKQVVVMSEKECLDQYERNSDSPAIMASHILDLLLLDRPNDSYTIVNLVEKTNIRFMHLLQGKDVAEEVDVFYTPAYAAGDVVADSLISNVLLSQTYYKPDIVSIIKTLCGMPGVDLSKNTILSNPTEASNSATQLASLLTSIPMPFQFAGHTYSSLFKYLFIEHKTLAIGLFRAPDDDFGNELPFVYTNPVPSLILKDSDMVYILAKPDVL